MQACIFSIGRRSLPEAAAPASGLTAGARGLFRWLAERQEETRQRARFLQLDDRMLRDLGLTRADVIAAAHGIPRRADR